MVRGLLFAGMMGSLAAFIGCGFGGETLGGLIGTFVGSFVDNLPEDGDDDEEDLDLE